MFEIINKLSATLFIWLKSVYKIELSQVTFVPVNDYQVANICSSFIFNAVSFAKKNNFKLDIDKFQAALLDYLCKSEFSNYFQFSIDKGYLNIKYKDEFFKLILNEGVYKPVENNKYSIEFISPNANKSLHVGHLLNMLIGDSISRILKYAGNEVRNEILINNRGISIAKLVWGYKNYDKANMSIDDLYVYANEKYESDPAIAKEIQNSVVNWEKEMTEVIEKFGEIDLFTFDFSEYKELNVWAEVIRLSYKNQKSTIERFLGDKIENIFDKFWFESNFFHLGKIYIDEGLDKKIFRKDEGAVLTDLKSYNITDTIILKSDGTALYLTQDIALAKLKSSYKADKYIYVVGSEQTLTLKQAFAVSDQFGIIPFNKFEHIAYPFVRIKGSGKMSSRKGNAVYADELLDEVIYRLKAMYPEKDIEFEKLALCALKFAFLKYARTTEIQFDIDEAISLTGFSGIYVMYAYVRMNNILSKIDDSMPFDNTESEFNIYEKNLLSKISEFQTVFDSASKEYAPHKICHYLFELAKLFNNFYENCRIIDDKRIVNNRYRLIKCQLLLFNLIFSILNLSTIERI